MPEDTIMGQIASVPGNETEKEVKVWGDFALYDKGHAAILGPGPTSILCYLARLTRNAPQSKCQVGETLIAQKTGISARSVSRHIIKLIERGYITVSHDYDTVNGGQKYHIYTVLPLPENNVIPMKKPRLSANLSRGSEPNLQGDTCQIDDPLQDKLADSPMTNCPLPPRQFVYPVDKGNLYEKTIDNTKGAAHQKLKDKKDKGKDISAASASAQGDELLPRGVASIKEAMVWLFTNKDIAPQQAIKMLARVNPATHKPYFRRDWLVMEAMRQKFTPDVVADREKDAGGACVRINKQLIPLASTDASEAVAIIVDTIYRTNETPSGSIVSYLYTTMKNRKEGKGYGVAAIEAQEEKRKKQIRAADKNCRYCQGYGRRSMYHSDGTPNGYLTDCECTGAVNDNG